MAANGRIATSNLTGLPKSWSNKNEKEHLRKDAYESLTRALNRAVADSGENFQIWDAYRSLSEQVAMLKRNYYAVRGGRRSGDRSYGGVTYRRRSGRPATASPGYSNHGTGLAIDIHSSGIQNWLQNNGRMYGWTWDEGRRLGESWHFVYKPSLDQMKSEGVLDHAWVQKVVGAEVDGKIGTGTIAKIKDWQKANGLTADGKVGSGTKAKMRGKIGESVADAIADAVSDVTVEVTLNSDYKLEEHPTKNLYEGRVRVNPEGNQSGELREIAIHHWGSDGQKYDNVVNWLVADGNGNNNSSAHEVISGDTVAVLAGYDDGTWNSGTTDGNLNNYAFELRPEADELTIRTAAARIKAARDHAGKDLPLKPHRSYVSTECPGRYMNLLGVLDRLAKGEDVAIIAGGYTAPAPAVNGEDLTVDGRWGRATSTEIQSRLGVKADGRMGPETYKALQEHYGTPVDGEISDQSYKSTELGNGIGPHGWDYNGPGSAGSTVIEKLQADVGADVDGVLYEGTTALVQKRLNSDPDFLVVGGVDVDGRFGSDTVKAAQEFLNSRGAKLEVDGKAGNSFWKALQKYLGTNADGKVSNQSHKADSLGNGITQGWEYTGPNSSGSSMVKALQKWIGVAQDGVWGETTTAAFQRKLIAHGFSV